MESKKTPKDEEKTQVKVVKIQESLKFPLSSEQYGRIASEIREHRAQIAKEKAMFKVTTEEHKAKVNHLTAKVERHLNTLEDGHEINDVEADAHFDFAHGTAEIWHDGKVAKTRKMFEKEWEHRTERLFPDEKPIATNISFKPKKGDGPMLVPGIAPQDPTKGPDPLESGSKTEIRRKDHRAAAAGDTEPEEEFDPDEASEQPKEEQIKDVMKAETKKRTKKSAV